MIWMILILIVVFTSILHIFLSKKPKNIENVLEAIILYWLVIYIGIGGLFGFFGHVFMADKIALSIGWQPGSPFQYEVGIANLAFAVMGLLCLFFKDNFWLATAIGQSVFVFGAAYGHIYDAVVHKNFAINNVGPVLFLNDLLFPIVLLALVFAYKRLKGF